MYSRLSRVMFPILFVALVGVGVWGYQEHREKNAILINAENSYQRAFHDLSYNMDKLQSELGNTLAINSTSHDFFKKNLINVWRLAAQAQSNVSQLPLSLLPFHKTEEFLANMSNFSYQTSVRNLSDKPLSDSEKEVLQTLYDNSKQLNEELRQVQTKVLSDHLRWMDVETALATNQNGKDLFLIDGFRKFDGKVGEFPEIQWGPSADVIHQSRNFQALSGSNVSADEVAGMAATFLGANDPTGFTVSDNSSDNLSEMYTVHGRNPYTGNEVEMDYTKKGGQLVWYMEMRDVADKVLDVRGARDAVLDFTEAHGYPGMEAVSYDEYNNVASLTLVPTMDGVLIYPAKMSVQVALDNGDVIGLQTTDYLYENQNRELAVPSMTAEEGAKYLNPEFQILEITQAIISNEAHEDVHCYQYYGQINGGHYRVFINANNGYEEKIEPVRQMAI